MTTPTDPLSILYPNDTPSTVPPAYHQAAVAAATSRLAGQGQPQKDHAAALYPDDLPKDAKPAQPAPAAQAKGETGKDDPATLTYDKDAAPFDPSAVNSFFDQAALAALQEGEKERSAELGQASKALVAEFSAAGTPTETVSEALRAFQDAAYSGVTEAPEAIMANLATEFGPTLETDLAAARSLIADLDLVAPGLVASLNATGAGNDPRIIRAAIREARRRGYGKG